jgi:hypothetical protein
MSEAVGFENEEAKTKGFFTGMMLFPKVRFRILLAKWKDPGLIMRQAKATSIRPRGI